MSGRPACSPAPIVQSLTVSRCGGQLHGRGIAALQRPIATCYSMVASKPLFLCCRMYSELISAAIATGGPHASKTTAVKLMRRWVGGIPHWLEMEEGSSGFGWVQSAQREAQRAVVCSLHASDWVPPTDPVSLLPCRPCSVKKVALRLIETMVDKCEDPDMVAAQVGAPR